VPDTKKVAPDFPDTVRRLQYLIDHLKLTSYLEIGLGNGGTFVNVNVAKKVGVDPTPWNPGVSELPGVHILTSDEYFSRHWNDGTKFDLILLDGLHTAEQTYRDFTHSLHFAHARTVWLIDDVMPNDKYSAIPDWSEAIARRKAETGSDDKAWHGDVYKVVWMIRAQHQEMTLRAFWKTQPQALVYFSQAAPNEAHGLTPAEIAGLTYDDTISRRSEYHPGEDKDILKECVAALKKIRSV
jgi:hypothetical protein